MEVDDEWELSKENVQPLRQGRQMSSLVAALHIDPSDEQHIRVQQSDFELELRSYSGTDPFDVWDRYIKWTEQHFPKGGHDGQLTKLIERCLKEFQSEDKYKDDPRFIWVWIKFACFSTDPVEVFAYMFDNAIGLTVSQLYIEWARSLERLGDNKRADAIYTEGLQRCAQPNDLLLQRHQQFQNRVARKITLQISEGQNQEMQVDDDDQEKRMALGRLKASKQSHKVGAARTGSALQGSAGTFRDSRSAVVQQLPSKGIQIYGDDESQLPNLQPPQTNEWKSMPNRAVDNRENEKKPGVWTAAKIKQKLGAVPSVPSSVPFQIHEDQDTEGFSQETPRKTTLINTFPLSSRKDHAQHDVLVNLRQSQNAVFNPNAGKPMYQKDKIYNGVSEFSFEELRAVTYWKKKQEAERLRKEEEQRQKEEKMAQQIQEANAKIAQLEAMFESQLKAISIKGAAECQPLQQCPPQIAHHDPSTTVSNDFITPTNDIAPPSNQGKFTGSGGSINKSLNSSQRTPIFGTISNYPSSTSSGRSNSSTTNSSLFRVGRACASSNSSSVATPISGYPTPESADSFSKKRGEIYSSCPLSAPSPTVYTMEAMKAVQQMYNDGFDLSDNTLADTQDMGSFSAKTSAAVPFEICVDQTCQIDDLAAAQPLAGARIPIFCDDDNSKENAVQSGTQVYKIPEPSLQPFGTTTGSKREGLTIRQSEEPMEETETKPAASPKNRTRRGLEFMPCGGRTDSEMSNMANEIQHMSNDFTIECQALDDQTLAPLDTFTLQARAASTPFSRGPAQAMSQGDLGGQGEEAVSTISSTTTTTTFEGSFHNQTPNKNLSPIFEGSGEGSGESSTEQSNVAKDFYASVTLRSRHPSTAATIPEEEEAEYRDVNMNEPHLLDASCHHQIDTSAYEPEMVELDDAGSSSSVCADPFDDDTIAKILKDLQPPLSDYPNYFAFNVVAPAIKDGEEFYRNGTCVMIEECIGEGGYAQVYKAVETVLETDPTTDEIVSLSEESVIKVQKPPCHWEFYVNCELRKRLVDLNSSMDVLPSVVEIKNAYFFPDTSILQMPFVPFGSLLQLVNMYKNNRPLLSRVEPFACLLAVELLHLFEQIHQCNVIHGDVKPDNFLLMCLPQISESSDPREVFGSKLRLLQLIDFGQSIDLSKFPAGTTFMAKVRTSGFQCIEMRTNRPWTFQTDLFGLAGTMHVVLFGTYMNVFQENGKWRITGNYVRKWNVPLWKRLFEELLNVPSCEQLPNLAAFRSEFEDYFVQNLVPDYNTWAREIHDLDSSLVMEL